MHPVCRCMNQTPPLLSVLASAGLRGTHLLPGLVLHQVLVEVDAEERADDLAGGHPPRQEGEEASEEDGGEDGAQRGERLRQPGHGGLDVLLHVLHPVLVIVQAAGGDWSGRGQDQRWSHAWRLL